ncbi:MAG TPA: TerB N-terminal domain-containing protein, partial [Polyangiaceae bacterium]|nr:TerB N-terminal domain-containing protein [Polyangiaceae bacterium]
MRDDAPKIPWLEAELAEEPEPIDLSFMAPAQSQPRAVRNEAPKISWLEAELAEEPGPEPVDTGTRSFGFFRSPAPTKVTKGPKAAWVPAGKSVTVAGIEISGGMIYFGRNLTGGQRDYRTEPALIDPSLPVNLKKARFDDTKLGYWPSYEGLEPADRAGYLQWLRDGRSDLGAPIGFVFLFFYGLERRALI